MVDLQPAAEYTPRLAITAGHRRTELGDITRTPDDSVVAAHRARRRAIVEGGFSQVVSAHGVHRTRYDRLADLRWRLRQNENWRLGGHLRRKLASAWARRAPGAQIEIRAAFSIAVLRKRG